MKGSVGIRAPASVGLLFSNFDQLVASAMGKGKDKKKKGLGKAKTEAREAKKADKARRKTLAQSGEDDVEAILAAILAKEELDAAVTPAPNSDPPSPRTHFSMVASTVSDSDLILFGGEHYTGERAEFFSTTYAYTVDKQTWTRYDSSTRPPPRSGHAVCTFKNFMYLFGGEFSNASLSQYRHYRDLWRLDMTDMSWEKLDVRGGPSARSGHRMCVVKGKLVVFGGYMDPGIGDVKYYNCMSYIDLTQDEFKWTKVETSVVDVVPSPRSAFQWSVFGDEAWLYGGYSRVPATKAKNMSHKSQKKGGASAAEEAMAARGVVHNDMFKLNGDTLKWTKVKRNGYGPSGRTGFSLVVHKRSFVVFGGVEDDETEEDLSSVFFNDLFGFNVDRKRWYPMTIRKRAKGGGGSRRRRKKEESEEASALAPVDSASAAMDVGDDDDGEDDDAELDTAALEAQMKKEEEEDKGPCPRFNAVSAVQRNVLYIMGGVVEKQESEVTLDDIWSVDLNKLEEFVQVKPLGEQCAEWVASDDEDDDEEDDDDEDEDMEDGESEDIEGEEDSSQRKKRRRVRLQERVAEVQDALMPRVFETLKEYFDRTRDSWYGEVYESLGESGKGSRRIAFEWAYKRYWEMKPQLKELEDLEKELQAEAQLEEDFAKAQLGSQRGRSRR
jgi:N-acetylneuraminic acid mutarotase